MTTEDKHKQLRDAVVEDMYVMWQMHYSKKNWLSYWPTFDQIDDGDRAFWDKFLETTMRRVKLASIVLSEKQC